MSNPEDTYECLLPELDPAIYEPDALLLRFEAIEELRFIQQQAQSRIANDQRKSTDPDDIEQMIRQLESISKKTCDVYRREITNGDLTGTSLRQVLNRYTGYQSGTNGHQHFDYEDLDILIKEVFEFGKSPEIYLPANPEFVHMERSPASVILDMIDHIPWHQDDVFIDLGSGFGFVPLLVHLLTGIETRGIEIDPDFYAFALRCKQALAVSGTHFELGDVRDADIQEGTVFYLFTPFTGSVLQSVLDKLQDISRQHSITIASFGPCTPWLSGVGWLHQMNNKEGHTFILTLFRSDKKL